MTEQQKQEFRNRYGKLPEPLREAISSVDTAEINAEIGKKFNLHLDQVGELGATVSYVMVGMIHPNGFVNALQKHVRVDETTANGIAAEVNEKIFLTVRDFIKKLYEEKEGGEPDVEQLPNREQLLREIENPQATAVSGRVLKEQAASAVPAPVTGGPREKSAAEEMENAASGSSSDIPAPIEKSKEKSILEQKLSETMIARADKQKIDPYREPTN